MTDKRQEKQERQKKQEKDVDQKIKEFTEKIEEHGMICGQKIAEIAATLHPGALIIVPLYRSCIVVEQNEQDKKEGSCKIHGYADPHWLGREISVDTLKSEDFHFYYKVQGYREGPEIVKMKVLPLMTSRVTGKIALMLEQNSDLTPAQIKEMLDKENL